ncbi:hypothetical protein [Marinomonas transparens]|nr:hypothetical protein [Marinomonas transparens]
MATNTGISLIELENDKQKLKTLQGLIKGSEFKFEVRHFLSHFAN